MKAPPWLPLSIHETHRFYCIGESNERQLEDLVYSDIQSCCSDIDFLDLRTGRWSTMSSADVLERRSEGGRAYTGIPITSTGLGKFRTRIPSWLKPFKPVSSCSSPVSTLSLFLHDLGAGTIISKLLPLYPGSHEVIVHLKGVCLWITFPRSPQNAEFMDRWPTIPLYEVGFLRSSIADDRIELVSYGILDSPGAFVLNPFEYSAVIATEASVYLKGSIYRADGADHTLDQLNTMMHQVRPRLVSDEMESLHQSCQIAISSLCEVCPSLRDSISVQNAQRTLETLRIM